MARIVEAVLIEDEGVGEGTDFQEPVPIRRVACQSRDFQAEHDAGFLQTHFGYQLLKSFPIRRRGCRLPEVAVDHDDPLDRPAQGHRTLPKIILPYGALGVLQHLAQGGLSDVQICVSLQMAGIYLFMRVGGHEVASC